ncbi:MAG: type I methionyl aminopeptidase [Deltaproteobacteria bacterium]|nr:type I methionyl aminopeptidase [Deltaproteobacteria bacterium]
MRASCLIVAEVLDVLRNSVKPGITTLDLERIAEEETKKRDAKPAFKGYRGYPFCLCTSLNSEVVHGMPSKKALKSGDILSIDFGVRYNGFYGDSAITVPVGEVSGDALRLIEVTKASLDAAIEQVVAGNRLTDVSSAVQRLVESHGFSVVREFVGHGIGRELHEPPQVPNFGLPGRGIKLKPGMVLAIEPMINMGGSAVKVLDDGWTAVTVDGSLSAHFEHTVAVTPDGPYVLSRI